MHQVILGSNCSSFINLEMKFIKNYFNSSISKQLTLQALMVLGHPHLEVFLLQEALLLPLQALSLYVSGTRCPSNYCAQFKFMSVPRTMHLCSKSLEGLLHWYNKQFVQNLQDLEVASRANHHLSCNIYI